MTRFAAILLSRQPLRPNGQTPWIKQVIAAVAWLKKNGYGLAASAGLQTWELLTFLSAREELPVKIYVPAEDPEEFASDCDSLTYQFGLDPDFAQFSPVYGSDGDTSSTSLMIRRDRLIVKQSQLLIPVSVRSEGGMANLITVARAFGRELNTDFEVRHEQHTDPLASNFNECPINPEVHQMDRPYVVHWTRANNGPWPGERLTDFYGDILDSTSWPRSGFETLRRIVLQKRIIASYLHMPAGTATVSLSALAPSEVVPLMKWRARYRQMSFEPYGVGFSREIAEAAGIRPVAYVDAGTDPEDVDERWLRQTKGRVTDWRQEKEYRIRGDFDFGRVSKDDVVLFCRTPQEAELLRREFPFSVMPVFRLG